MSKIAEILGTMDYGPAPESSEQAQAWLAAHDARFGLYIDTDGNIGLPRVSHCISAGDGK